MSDFLGVRITGFKRYVNGDIFVFLFERLRVFFLWKDREWTIGRIHVDKEIKRLTDQKRTRIRKEPRSKFTVPQGAIAF
jgi:hypothetical protein